MTRQRSIQIVEKCYEYDFISICLDLLRKSHEEFLSILASDKLINNSTLLILTLKYVLTVLRSFTNYSTKFCIEFHNQNGIHLLFQYLKNDFTIDIYLKSYQKPKSIKFILLNWIIRSLIGTLLNLSKEIDKSNFKQQWKDCEAVCYKKLL
jgi:hypothetical protein